MPTSQPSSVISAMRRYQRIALFGGGIALTVMVLVTFGLAVASMIRAYVDNEQRELEIESRRIISEFVKVEIALRSTVSVAEMVWNQHQSAASDAVGQFYTNRGRLVLQQGTSSPALLFASSATDASVPDLSRFIALAQHVTDTTSATVTAQGFVFSAYLYTPQRDLAAWSSGKWPSQVQIDTALSERAGFFDALTRNEEGPIEPASITDAKTGLRAVRLTGPYHNPLTGEEFTRLATYALDADSQPFAVFVYEVPLTLTTRLLSIDRFGGTFVITDHAGALVAASQGGSNRPEVQAAIKETRQSMVPIVQRASNGVYTVSVPIGLTGWRLAYAYSWRDVLAGVWPQIRWTPALTVGLISVLWLLLWWYNWRVLVPMLAHTERAAEAEHLNRLLIETAPIGLGVIDAKTGRPMLRSPAMVDVASRVVTKAPTLSAEIAQRFADNSSYDKVHEDIAFATRDGGQLDLEVNLTQARYQNADVLVTAFTDVTDKKRTEQALRDAKQAADEANRAKSAFLSTMSHEIRTPLNAILGNLELVQRMVLPPLAGQRLQAVTSSSNALLGIISDVLDFSKIEAGQMSIESVAFDPAAVVSEVAAIFEPVAQEKGLQFDCIVDREHLAPNYLGDPTRIRQIAANLLSNAIKFTDTGDVLIEVYARDDGTRLPGIVIGVSDSGIGIGKEQQARLFEPFVQADSTITRRFGGSGLGLALCRRLVAMMDGSIELRSEPDDGSQFMVKLPLVPTDAPASSPSAMGAAADKAELSAIKVLAVDDQASNRELIRIQLEELGYRVNLACNGSDALLRFNQESYDLVLTDLSMPGMDGYALSRSLRSQGATVPVVAMTAHAEIEEHRRCTKEGIDAVLVKPILLNNLSQTLSKVLHTQTGLSSSVQREGIGSGRLPESVLSALQESTRSLMVSLRAATPSSAPDTLLRDLHALKGMFAMIRELEVAETCARIEQQVQQNYLEELPQALEHLAVQAQDALMRRSV